MNNPLDFSTLFVELESGKHDRIQRALVGLWTCVEGCRTDLELPVETVKNLSKVINKNSVNVVNKLSDPSTPKAERGELFNQVKTWVTEFQLVKNGLETAHKRTKPVILPRV